MKRILAVLLLVVASLTLTTTASATTEHCPDGGTKVEAVADELNDIIPAAGTLVCVKGSTDATGIVVADGQTSLVDILGNGHDVSYYVTYEGEEPPPDPVCPEGTDKEGQVIPEGETEEWCDIDDPTPPPPTDPPPTDDPNPPKDPPPPPAGCKNPPCELAFTGLDATGAIGIGVVLAALGALSLWYARKLKIRG